MCGAPYCGAATGLTLPPGVTRKYDDEVLEELGIDLADEPEAEEEALPQSLD